MTLQWPIARIRKCETSLRLAIIKVTLYVKILRIYLSQFPIFPQIWFLCLPSLFLSLCSFLSSFTLTMLSRENLSQAKEKDNTALSEETAMGTCPAKMGAISVSEMVQQLQDSSILQSCPPKPEHHKSKRHCGKD